MDANLEHPNIVLQACCKTVLDFDKAAPEMVEVEDEEDNENEPALVSITFFWEVQFLFFGAMEKQTACDHLDMHVDDISSLQLDRGNGDQAWYCNFY
jgi:hypothetical protein